MRPNSVVIGFIETGPKEQFESHLHHNLKKEVLDQIEKFADLHERLAEKEFIRILKDINRAGKNILVARKYVCSYN